MPSPTGPSSTVARDGPAVVGAATGAPLEDQDAAFVDALRPHHAPETVFYCGESVLLPAYRGRGLGHGFFDAREARARALGRTVSAFCAVIRPADHPARPPSPRDLSPFWRKRGYRPLDAVAQFSWTDLGASEATAKPLGFWHRRL